MSTLLGLDIGSNSVGSAWIDTDQQEIHLAASVFPAGVDEQENKRGAPKNQARRQTRSQRRTIDRRARRKRQLARFLMERDLLPRDPDALRQLFDLSPWQLRRKALKEPLSAHEFGRLVLHLTQRRGAVGVVTDPEDPDEGMVKEAMDRLARLLKERGAETVGQLMAGLMDERRQRNGAVTWNEPIRNRQYRLPQDQQLFAGRELIRNEFHRIVEMQRSLPGSELARILTNELVAQLDDPSQSNAWRHRGLLFGQRRTYWDTATLGRCVLEPTERCAPLADRHAGYFRVVETVNNIRIETPVDSGRPLTAEERGKLMRLLRGPLGQRKQKGKLVPKTSASVTDIKRALSLNPRDKTVRLSIEADEDREINTDWFHREIVHGAFGEQRWNEMSEQQKESVNRAILKFDPDHEDDAGKLRAGAVRWWGLDQAPADRMVEAWKGRPKLEKRLNLSRRAILNLLPYMETFDTENCRWPTQQEARKAHALVLQTRFKDTGECEYELAAQRYATGARGLSSADRYYLRQKKHEIAPGIAALPPAPMLSNPVVRKAIHEVRRHITTWIQKFRRNPDRIVIELARITKQSERRRNAALSRNRRRNKIRNTIIKDILPAAFGEEEARKLSLNQQHAAIDRVVLARQQTQICPYCGTAGLTDMAAAKGNDLEIDHIVPYSRCGIDALHNKVLVHRTRNRGKANQTPREWWGPEFSERVRFAEKLFKDAKPTREDYFTKRDCARKWQNFNRELRESEEFKSSQLTDTAYAARQVAAYLSDALFDGRGLPERGDGADRQRIFFTVGKFTLMLRKDWQLFETLKPARQTDGRHGNLTAEDELELAGKNRGDHREHAVDAVTIALTDPKIKNALATWAARAAEYKEKHGESPRRTPIPPPWGDVPTFRRQVLSKIYDTFDSSKDASGHHDARGGPNPLVVSHRPVKRRLVGHLHKQTLYGPVFDQKGQRIEDRATVRQPIWQNAQSHLKPAHLRLPVRETRDQAVKRIARELRKAGAKPRDAKQRAIGLVDSPGFQPALIDPPPAKTGIVRDLSLRKTLRDCIKKRALDPDNFVGNELKAVIDRDGPLCQPSGVPIKSAVLLWANNDPVIIPRSKWNAVNASVEPDPDPRTRERELRIYDSQNNHHVEIREADFGEWTGSVVRAFEVSTTLRKRLRALAPLTKPLRHLRQKLPKDLGAGLSKEDRAQLRSERARANLAEWKRRMRELKRERSRIIREYPIVDRSDNDDGRFVMSLAEGEMIYARRNDRPDEPPDYFVVCKLDKPHHIHFAPHWDARKASQQDRWSVTPGDLKNCGPQPNQPPYKVRVGPLGRPRRLERD